MNKVERELWLRVFDVSFEANKCVGTAEFNANRAVSVFRNANEAERTRRWAMLPGRAYGQPK
jgi:hypothetical protein